MVQLISVLPLLQRARKPAAVCAAEPGLNADKRGILAGRGPNSGHRCLKGDADIRGAVFAECCVGELGLLENECIAHKEIMGKGQHSIFQGDSLFVRPHDAPLQILYTNLWKDFPIFPQLNTVLMPILRKWAEESGVAAEGEVKRLLIRVGDAPSDSQRVLLQLIGNSQPP